MKKGFQEGNVRRIEDDKWKLGYTDEFKQFVHQHPSIIRDVVERLSKIANDPKTPEGFRVEEGEIIIALEKRRLKSNIYSIQAHGRKFFLKMSRYAKEQAYDEFVDSSEAKKRIAEVMANLPIPVEVVDYQLGFTQGGLNFFVAPWMDLVDVSEYQKTLTSLGQKRDFDQTLMILFEIFKDYVDFRILNMAYNPATNKIVIFDLQKK